MPHAKSANHNLLTLASMAAVASVAADMVHEALGHGTAALVTGDRILSLSTVAIQNATANRFVSAAGTTANGLVGTLSFLLFHRANCLTAATYFLRLFGVFNLLNSGYLVASAVLNNGDWAHVIAGLSPGWAWRSLLGLTGTAFYVLCVRWAARELACKVGRSPVEAANLHHLILPGYLVAGAVMTLASVFNPISPSLILLSGVGASFGLNAGLLFIPEMVARSPQSQSPAPLRIAWSFSWFLLALAFVGIFVAILGPGIRFSR